MRTAINSTAHGLCMFDASERMVVCNSQYYNMYELTSADVKTGATLSEVLEKRVAKGTFFTCSIPAQGVAATDGKPSPYITTPPPSRTPCRPGAKSLRMG